MARLSLMLSDRLANFMYWIYTCKIINYQFIEQKEINAKSYRMCRLSKNFVLEIINVGILGKENLSKGLKEGGTFSSYCCSYCVP